MLFILILVVMFASILAIPFSEIEETIKVEKEKRGIGITNKYLN